MPYASGAWRAPRLWLPPCCVLLLGCGIWRRKTGWWRSDHGLPAAGLGSRAARGASGRRVRFRLRRAATGPGHSARGALRLGAHSWGGPPPRRRGDGGAWQEHTEGGALLRHGSLRVLRWRDIRDGLRLLPRTPECEERLVAQPLARGRPLYRV